MQYEAGCGLKLVLKFGKSRGDGGSIVQSTYIELDLVGGQLGSLQHCF